MSRVPRSVLRRLVFAVDGWKGGKKRRKRHKESGDRLRCTAGLHLPIQSKGAKCDSRRKKKSGLPCDKPDVAQANCSLSVIKEHIFQNHKKLKITLSPLVILLCCALSRSPRRGLSGGAAIDKPTGRCLTLRPPHPPSLSRREKQHDFRAKVHSFSSEMHHLSPLPHTRATRHAPSHPRFSRGAFFAFTLHLHTYSSDIQTLTCELYPHFLLHRGEGKGGEAFTLITLSSNDLHARGEEVKGKNEKRRTRSRARKTPKNGALPTGGARHLSCRADHLGEAPSDRKNRPRFAQQSNSLFPFLPCKRQQSVRSALAGTAIFPAPSCKTTKTPRKTDLLPFDFERTDAFLQRNR